MKTIRLEILRHGPPHNQLLSPLTEYLALCENHPSVQVRLPFEHAEFMLRLRQMQDLTAGAGVRELELEDVARKVTEVLSQVPGLIREVSDRGADGVAILHLRLILSANELALLPFEIANASAGFAGAGQSLFLQSQAPVCITREVRRVATEETAWPPPPNPKILFAAAAPEAPVPLEPHLLALRQAIEPWMMHYRRNDAAERRLRVAEHLTLLPQATLRQIEQACASGEYTHVHILAHGIPMAKGDDRRFGLVLHRAGNPARADLVEATRVAKALRPPLRNGSGPFARPAVVTVAACNAGNVGSVVGAGASIAHSLHEEGIPLVVASQFPLSFSGSVILTKVLYEGLLWGQDPRTLLVNLRRQLRTQAPATYDWASVVAYASFPPDLDQQLARIRINQGFRSLWAAIHHADRMLAEEPSEAELQAQRLRLREARGRIEDLVGKPQCDTSAYGVLASSEKRLAEILYRMKEAAPQSTREFRADVRDRLISARRYYGQAFQSDRSAWALVQALALTAVLQKWNPNDGIHPDDWLLARILSERDLHSPDPRLLAWAHANLIELYLLAPVVKGPPIKRAAAEKQAQVHAKAFRKMADLPEWEVRSTRQQLLRYPEFFAVLNEKLGALSAPARTLANLMPESAVSA